MSYWAVARLEPRREQLRSVVSAWRAARRIFHGCASIGSRTDAGSRFQPPLFPSYCFLTVEAQWYAARWSIGVIGLIMDGLRPARVADQIIDDLRKRERNGQIELPQRDKLKPGDQVRKLQGPFAGHLGLYAGMRAHERVLVLLALLGGQQRVELAKDVIEGV
jgi:transcriptional antiterminator RfaH